MDPKPEISELEFTGTTKFSKSSLPDDHASVFEELEINVRRQEVLEYKDTNTGELYTVKFVGMNFYPTNSRANPEGAKDCYNHDIAAIGWHNTEPDSKSPIDLLKSIVQTPDDVYRHDRDAAHFLLWLDKNDIILTSNQFGDTAYHYARVLSEPKHASEATDTGLQEALERNSFGFYRDVEWIEVPQEEAPGPVTSMTVRGRTLANKDMDIMSKHQIIEQFEENEIEETTRIDATIDYNSFGERLQALADETTRGNSNQLLEGFSTRSSHNGLEDVVCSYIQHETGAKIKPATQYHRVVEYLFRGMGANDEALTFGVQVKKGDFGGERARLKEFASKHDRLYLYSASGDIIEGENIVNIHRSELTEYICNRPQELDPTELDRLRRRLVAYEDHHE